MISLNSAAAEFFVKLLLSSKTKPLHVYVWAPANIGPPNSQHKKPPIKSPLQIIITSPGLLLGNCLQIQIKTKQKGKFSSNYKASPIDFKTQISLCR